MGFMDAHNTLATTLNMFANSGSDVMTTSAYDTGPIATGNSGADMGTATELLVRVTVTTTFTGASGSLVTFTVESSSSATDFSSSTTHYTSAAYSAETGLNAYKFGDSSHEHQGTVIYMRLSPGETWNRYVGVRASTTAANSTAGACTVDICTDPAVIAQYASGMNFDS